MSRTDLDPATLAKAIRRMAGDGSIDWVMEPIQASVLLDVADMLDENATLRQQLADVTESMGRVEERCAKLRELVADMYKSMDASCRFGHAIPAGTMAHVKNRAIGLGGEVDW